MLLTGARGQRPRNSQPGLRAGNRTHMSADDGGLAKTYAYGYDAMNRLLGKWSEEDANVTYYHDEMGRLLAKETDGVGIERYDYDRLDRLTGVDSDNDGAFESVYDYAASTWMRERAVTPAGETAYAYDGFACVSQSTKGVATSYAVHGGRWKTGAHTEVQIESNNVNK